LELRGICRVNTFFNPIASFLCKVKDLAAPPPPLYVAQVKHLHLNHWFVSTRRKHFWKRSQGDEWGFCVPGTLERPTSSCVGSFHLSECGVEEAKAGGIVPYNPRKRILNRSCGGEGDVPDLLPSVMKLSTTVTRAVACTA
jgi:hypothetical protein